MIDFLICSFMFIITFLLCGMVYVINHERKEQDYIEFCKLLEKDTPKKAIANGIKEGRQVNTVSYTCPSCNNHIGRDNFCKHCGQALDWSKEDDC